VTLVLGHGRPEALATPAVRALGFRPDREKHDAIAGRPLVMPSPHESFAVIRKRGRRAHQSSRPRAPRAPGHRGSGAGLLRPGARRLRRRRRAPARRRDARRRSASGVAPTSRPAIAGRASRASIWTSRGSAAPAD
jgi:hypothetical protein